ncbi:zinc finger protein 407 isoform X2 [Betta splendens]|uniref:Zinc finger protein 407 isoform X2 n=1 Tax=Betta splendens TaxID=158456 RepID=A0A6P7KX60_BETSP|nr:zinc finger protein 407 isoform X2 [Betta splendens]
MDKTTISQKKTVKRKVPESETSGKVQPDDVEMEEDIRDSLSRTENLEETDEKHPEAAPEIKDTLCAVCGFSAKGSRSLKIHYAKKHGKNSKNKGKTPEHIADVSPAEIQQDVDMGELELSASDNSGNIKLDQEDCAQERRVSKRTPKPKMIFSCNYCGQEFRDKAPLDVHVQRHHAKDTPYSYDADDNMDYEEETVKPDVTPVKTNTPMQVVPKHLVNRFQLKCAHCDFRVSTASLLESHTRVKHLDQNWYRCKLCNFFSATSEWMDNHLSSDNHKQKQKGREAAESPHEVYVECVSHTSGGDATPTTDRAAADEEGDTLTEGEQETEGVTEAVDAFSEEEDLDLEPPKKKRGRPKQGSTTTCGYCGLVVSNATNLSVHVRRKHSKEYGYSCTLCNYSCVTKGDMDRHCITKKHVRRTQECVNKDTVNNQQEPTITQTQEPNGASETTDKEQGSNDMASDEHSKEEQTSQRKPDTVNSCSHCDFVALSIPSLHLHIRRRHTKEFEYVCLACSYYAVTSREMSRHASTEKHKQKSQKYLEQPGSEGQSALKMKEVIELARASVDADGDPPSPAEESEACPNDIQTVECQITAVGTDLEAGVSGSADEKHSESVTSTGASQPVTDPQQTPADLQPPPQELREEEDKQGDEEINADGMNVNAKSGLSQTDTHLSKAPPFDACIVSMKVLAEQELQESLALEGEAAVICLTGGSPTPIDPLPSSSAYVKKVKPKEGRARDEAKGNSSRIRCEDCGFMADGLSGLSVHVSMKHPSKEKHFHCLVCGKSFFSESNLHQHLNSAAHHRNEQNSVEELPEGGASFKCVKCTDRFETEQDLFVHIKEKHEELLREVNKYVLEDTEQINREREENQGSVCKYCGKVCKSSNSMAFLAHIRTHTVPPAAITMQAVEELVRRSVQKEVFVLRKSLDELAQDNKKALEDNSSLRRTIVKLEQELHKLRDDNCSVRQALRTMAERARSRNECGDWNDESERREQLLPSPSQERVPPSPTPSPSRSLAGSASSSCAETQVSPHLPSSSDGASTNETLPAPQAPSKPNALPDIVLQPVDPKVEAEIFRNSQLRYGPRRPDEYAAKMFMMIVDFPTYLSWTHKVNWRGSDGKQALPRNVIFKLRELLLRRFNDLTVKEWKEIRDRVNERLRNPRKADPRIEKCFL